MYRACVFFAANEIMGKKMSGALAFMRTRGSRISSSFSQVPGLYRKPVSSSMILHRPPVACATGIVPYSWDIKSSRPHGSNRLGNTEKSAEAVHNRARERSYPLKNTKRPTNLPAPLAFIGKETRF